MSLAMVIFFFSKGKNLFGLSKKENALSLFHFYIKQPYLHQHDVYLNVFSIHCVFLLGKNKCTLRKKNLLAEDSQICISLYNTYTV